MDKYIIDKSNGLWYERQGDYYIPYLTLATEEKQFIGLWGQQRLRYIKGHCKVLYTSLLANGKLNGYLADIEQQVQDRLDTIYSADGTNPGYQGGIESCRSNGMGRSNE